MELSEAQKQELINRLLELRKSRDNLVEQANRELVSINARIDEIQRLLQV